MSEIDEPIDENDENDIEEKESLKDFFRTKGLFIIIWLFCFVAVSIVFLVKLDDIKTNIKNTHFFERIFGTAPDFIKNHVDKSEKNKANLGESETIININTKTGRTTVSSYDSNYTDIPIEEAIFNQNLAAEKAELENVIEETVGDDNISENQKELNENSNEENLNNESKNPDKRFEIPFDDYSDLPKPTKSVFEEQFIPKTLPQNQQPEFREKVKEVEVQMMNAKLWFVTVDSDGRISRKQCVRRIVKPDAPLTNNIKLILQGPNYSERESGCLSFIPNGTRLLNALVKDGVAYLNFSREFENNTVGVDGIIAQLQQIVFTSTEFATVKSVQILIDGQKKETLGTGFRIDSPLSRESFD